MRRGGTYERETEGAEPKRIGGTKSDPRGDRARKADGVALNGRPEKPPRPAGKTEMQQRSGGVAADAGGGDIGSPPSSLGRRKAKES